MILRIVKGCKRRVNRFIRFKRDVSRYNYLVNESESKSFQINSKRYFKIYNDKDEAANVDMHYFLQDYYFAKIINEKAPKQHYDIGSRVDGFIAHLLSANRKVTMIDIRPFSISIDGLGFIQADATKLDGIEDGSIESISSLHAIEHFGLGRYGDDIDPDGWLKALRAIEKKIKTGGTLYLGLPISPEDRLYYNAHRTFNPETIVSAMPEMKVESFSYIRDYKIFNIAEDKLDNFFSHEIGGYIQEGDCGLFIMKKR